jgi:hypothetical protein
MVKGVCLCLNCRDRRHPHLRCTICHQVAPGEQHHVASERQLPQFTIPVCLNCHALLSTRQYRWPREWKTEPHPVRCLVQGVHDVVCLWLERSPVMREPAMAASCRALLAALGKAALYLLPFLRPAALADLGRLTGWGTP